MIIGSSNKNSETVGEMVKSLLSHCLGMSLFGAHRQTCLSVVCKQMSKSGHKVGESLLQTLGSFLAFTARVVSGSIVM